MIKISYSIVNTHAHRNLSITPCIITFFCQVTEQWISPGTFELIVPIFPIFAGFSQGAWKLWDVDGPSALLSFRDVGCFTFVSVNLMPIPNDRNCEEFATCLGKLNLVFRVYAVSGALSGLSLYSPGWADCFFHSIFLRHRTGEQNETCHHKVPHLLDCVLNEYYY